MLCYYNQSDSLFREQNLQHLQFIPWTDNASDATHILVIDPHIKITDVTLFDLTLNTTIFFSHSTDPDPIPDPRFYLHPADMQFSTHTEFVTAEYQFVEDIKIGTAPDDNEWIIHPGMDSPGNDLTWISGATVSQLKEITLRIPQAVGFNTYGYIKSQINSEKLISLPMIKCRQDGLYQKKNNQSIERPIISKKIVGFYQSHLCNRGSTVLLFNYAYYNQKILGNKSIVYYNRHHTLNYDPMISQFRRHFEVYSETSFEKFSFLRDGLDVLYSIKPGDHDKCLAPSPIKNVIHCTTQVTSPHGNVYASISPYISGYTPRFPVVPYIISLLPTKLNLRQHLGIPPEAIVFGRYGGYDNFDMGYVWRVVYDVAFDNPHLYFLFANTSLFCAPLPNIIHLPYQMGENKTAFIEACDAMLWGYTQGKAFSVSMGEFSTGNKPIIAIRSGNLGFCYVIRTYAYWYYDMESLTQILTNFRKFGSDELSKPNWNAYSEHTPERVMAIFKTIFLDI